MITLEIVRFCAIECELQGSQEISVYNMCNAWDYAMEAVRADNAYIPTLDDVQHIGALIEPKWNKSGFRTVDVRVGWDVKMPWPEVPQAMNDLMNGLNAGIYSPSQFCHEFLDPTHPFRDGNGRTSAVLYNWLSGTLDDPQWHTDWWKDSRRKPNYGRP